MKLKKITKNNILWNDWEYGKSIYNPIYLKEITKLIASVIPDNITHIVGSTSSGITLATALSLKTEIPLIAINKHTSHYPSNPIKGNYKEDKNNRILFIDDTIGTGKTLFEVMELMPISFAIVLSKNAMTNILEGYNISYINISDTIKELKT